MHAFFCFSILLSVRFKYQLLDVGMSAECGSAAVTACIDQCAAHTKALPTSGVKKLKTQEWKSRRQENSSCMALKLMEKLKRASVQSVFCFDDDDAVSTGTLHFKPPLTTVLFHLFSRVPDRSTWSLPEVCICCCSNSCEPPHIPTQNFMQRPCKKLKHAPDELFLLSRSPLYAFLSSNSSGVFMCRCALSEGLEGRTHALPLTSQLNLIDFASVSSGYSADTRNTWQMRGGGLITTFTYCLVHFRYLNHCAWLGFWGKKRSSLGLQKKKSIEREIAY